MTATRTRHVPLRRCAVCRTSQPKSELIRFARDAAGAWLLDSRRQAGGRGVWVCRQSRCHERKPLGRAFRSQAADVAAQLEKYAEPGGPGEETVQGANSSESERPEQVTRERERVRPDDGGIDV